MNLVELDPPAAPKRTCSLPNLAWNASSSIPMPSGQNHREMLFVQHHAASTISRGTCEGFLALHSVPAAYRLPVCGDGALSVLSSSSTMCGCATHRQP